MNVKFKKTFERILMDGKTDKILNAYIKAGTDAVDCIFLYNNPEYGYQTLKAIINFLTEHVGLCSYL